MSSNCHQFVFGRSSKRYINIKYLEKELLCQRLLFKKIVLMPKGQFPKLKGATVNVHMDVSETIKRLPCTDGLTLLKLKKKFSFRGHVYLEPVSRTKLLNALIYPKASNPLYHDITIDVSEIPSDLISFSDEPIDFSVNTSSEEPKSQDFEEGCNPLDGYRQACNESLIMDKSVFNIAPGEDKEIKSILLDENCEELAFPSLFPNGKFGYLCKRQKKLSWSKYINQRLLNYSQRFESNIFYLIFSQTILQLKSQQEQISIAMRKHSSPLNASMFQNYKESIRNIVGSDQAFYFMNSVKGSPVY